MIGTYKAALCAVGALLLAILPLFLKGDVETVLEGAAFAGAVALEVVAFRTLTRLRRQRTLAASPSGS